MLPPLHGLLFLVSSKGTFMHHPTDRIAPTFVNPVVRYWQECEIAWGIDPTTHHTMSGRSIMEKYPASYKLRTNWKWKCDSRWMCHTYLLRVSVKSSELSSQLGSDFLLGRRHGALVLRDGGGPQRLGVRVVLQRIHTQERSERLVHSQLVLLLWAQQSQ